MNRRKEKRDPDTGETALRPTPYQRVTNRQYFTDNGYSAYEWPDFTVPTTDM